MIHRVENQPLDVVVEQFLVERVSEGLSAPTLRSYRQSIGFFIKDMELTSVEDITNFCISKWIVMLKERGCRVASINHYLGDVRVFAYWLMNMEYIKGFSIKLLRGQESLPKTYSEEDLKKMVKPTSPRCSFTEDRTRVIICFILSTGARASTVVNLRQEDVDFRHGNITYTETKAKKVQTLPLTRKLSVELNKYIHSWDMQSEWLFPDRHGNKLTVDGLRQALEQYCKDRGIKCKGIHALRHSFARGWIKNGGNAFMLQRVLGHSDLTMTKRYCRIFNDDLKKNYENFDVFDQISQNFHTISHKN